MNNLDRRVSVAPMMDWSDDGEITNDLSHLTHSHNVRPHLVPTNEPRLTCGDFGLPLWTVGREKHQGRPFATVRDNPRQIRALGSQRNLPEAGNRRQRIPADGRVDVAHPVAMTVVRICSRAQGTRSAFLDLFRICCASQGGASGLGRRRSARRFRAAARSTCRLSTPCIRF